MTNPDLVRFTGEYASVHSFSGFNIVAGHPRLAIVYYALRYDYKDHVNGNDQQLRIIQEDLRDLETTGITHWKELRRYSKNAGDVFAYNIGGCGVAVAGRHLVVALAIGALPSDGQLHPARDIIRNVVPQ